MCGRYVQVTTVEKIEKRFNVTADPEEAAEWQANVNVSPGEKAPVITSENPTELQWMHFGMRPHWAQKSMLLINARAEGDHNKSNSMDYTGAKGIIQKPAFRKPIRSQRCIIPADAFFEGPEKEKLSKPYLVYLKNKKRPFAFAGVYDEWVNEATGEVFKGFSIITTAANKVTHAIGHHRCPMILPPEHESNWLNTALPLQDVVELLRPFPSDEMNAYPVDAKMKDTKVKDKTVLDPIGERVFVEYDLQIGRKVKLEGMGQTQARTRENEK